MFTASVLFVVASSPPFWFTKKISGELKGKPPAEGWSRSRLAVALAGSF